MHYILNYNKKDLTNQKKMRSRTIRIMKLTCFLLMTVLLQISATAYSQATKFDMQMENATIKEIFKSIEDQSNFRFFYSDNLTFINQRLNVDMSNVTVESILDRILDQSDLTYRIFENNLIVVTPEGTIQQGITITGVVTDAFGEPIPGVTVTVKGTTQGTATDTNGAYSLPVLNENTILVFSYIGYITQEISVGNRRSINITLNEDTRQMDEVVVIGYGTQKKETLTGSVVALKGSEIIKSPTVNLTSSLAGKLPGVIITNRNGEPGRENVSLYIRGRSTTGNSSALVIIDGVERGGMGQLNPNDIESISVLKDASAAIYGSRAANGVILITTKRGELTKPTINFSYNQGFSQPTRNPKMADAYTFAKVYNEIEINEGRNPRYSDSELQKFRDGSDPNYPNTDWYDFIVKKATPQNRANLSVAGGNEKVKYYMSLGEVTQKGQYKFSSINYTQINMRSNVDVQITDHLKAGMNLSGRYEDKHYPYESTNNLNSHIWLYLPIWQPYWPGTDYMMPNRDGQNILNWVTDNAGTVDQKIKTIQSSLFFKWDLPWIKGLSIDGNGSYDYGDTFAKTFRTPNYVYYKDAQTGEYEKGLAGSSPQFPNLTDRIDISSLFYLTAKVNYDRKIGFHNFNAMFGYEQTQIKGNYIVAARSDFLSATIPQIFAGSSDKNKQSNDGNASQDAKQNYFGRIIYDYSSKYLLSLTMRIDGSPRFNEGKRFGYFPGVSAGWRISEESFMKDITYLQNLKIRGSYGKMGNDLVNAFQYLTTYRFGNNYVIGNGDVSGLIQDGVPNPNITWETAKTWNIGLDASLWHGLLNVEFDFFKTRREDILTKRTVIVPDYTGLTLPDENIGIVDNKGFELILSHNNQINDFSYSISGNVSFARNKVVFADEQPAAEPYQMATGRPYGSALYYKAIGIFKDKAEVDSKPHMSGAQPGDIIFEDLNNDNVIDSRDRYRENKTNIPEIVFGLTANFAYKGFDMYLFFQGQENAKQSLGTYFPVMSYSLGNFTEWRAKDRWAPDHTTANMPRGSSGMWNNNHQSNSSTASTQWLFDSGFLRFKNIEVGYNLPTGICNKLRVQNLRIFVSGSNLLIIYDHMKELGFDPETNDFWYYPPQRLFNFGVNLSF